MTGIGLAVLWIGYTSFAYGHALIKGANVTFSDMVLPSHRTYALAALAASPSTGAKGATTTPGVPGASGQTPLGPTSQVEQLSGAGLASSSGAVAGINAGGSLLGRIGKALGL